MNIKVVKSKESEARQKSLETLKCYYDELELTDDLPAFYEALED